VSLSVGLALHFSPSYKQLRKKPQQEGETLKEERKSLHNPVENKKQVFK
jgi:hypothetical protein